MPSCTAVRGASAPPRRPNGVRAAERMTVWDTAAGYRARPAPGCGLLIPSITNAIRLQRHGPARARILRERPARSASGTRLRRARRRQEGPPRRQLHRPRRCAPVPAHREVDLRRLGLGRGDHPRRLPLARLSGARARALESRRVRRPGPRGALPDARAGQLLGHARGRRRHLPARRGRAPGAARRVDARRRQRVHARPRARALGRRRADRRAAPRRRAPRRARPAARAVPDREDPAAARPAPRHAPLLAGRPLVRQPLGAQGRDALLDERIRRRQVEADRHRPRRHARDRLRHRGARDEDLDPARASSPAASRSTRSSTG